MYGFIYITTNLVNNKKYLGQCKYEKNNVSKYLGSGKAITKAFKKYGISNFKRVIIEECETKQELSEREIELIQLFDCVNDPNWYNIATGGYASRGFLGKKHSKETKEKMSKSYKRVLTESGLKQMAVNGSKTMKEFNSTRDYSLMRGKTREKFECIHCKSLVSRGNLIRWHNEKCKSYMPTISEIMS